MGRLKMLLRDNARYVRLQNKPEYKSDKICSVCGSNKIGVPYLVEGTPLDIFECRECHPDDCPEHGHKGKNGKCPTCASYRCEMHRWAGKKPCESCQRWENIKINPQKYSLTFPEKARLKELGILV